MAAITSFGNLSVKLQSKAFIGQRLRSTAFPTCQVSHGRPASLAVRAEAADGERKKTGAELREEFFLAAATGKERGLPEGAFLNDNVVDGPMVDITWEPYGDTCSALVSAYNATYFSFRGAFGKEGASDIDGTVASVSDNRRQIREILASSASPDADVSAGMGVGGCDFLQSGCESDCPICASAGAGGRSSDVESPPCLIGLTTAAQFARKDATLLARGFWSLDSRAREDVALLGSKFLTLDARAREDAGVLDARARLRVRRLRHLALGLEESAREELSRQAAQHWRDGALAADLRLADMRMRRRGLEDVFLALQVVKSLHSAIVTLLRPDVLPSTAPSTPASTPSNTPANTTRRSSTPLHPSAPLQDSSAASIPSTSQASMPPSSSQPLPVMDSQSEGAEGSRVEEDGEQRRSVSTNPLTPRHQQHPLSTLSFKTLAALDELYREIGPHSLTPVEGEEDGEEEEWGVLGVGGDDSTTEELGFLLAALVDMGEVSSSYGLALLHRCCDSPHAALRLTAVDALSSAPSLSALGNAGCAVLQTLSKDADPEVAEAAAMAITQLQEKWQQQQQEQQQEEEEAGTSAPAALSLEQAFSRAAAKWQHAGSGGATDDEQADESTDGGVDSSADGDTAQWRSERRWCAEWVGARGGMADDEVVEVRGAEGDEQGEVRDGASDYEDYGDDDVDDDVDEEEDEAEEEEVEEDTQGGVEEEEEVQEADTPRGRDSQYKASRCLP
ncbi:unnamed protein product [Closterium sp. Naga37s-1]|nr:unnamed protein product [Closterium sp. Naga37s-1]